MTDSLDPDDSIDRALDEALRTLVSSRPTTAFDEKLRARLEGTRGARELTWRPLATVGALAAAIVIVAALTWTAVRPAGPERTGPQRSAATGGATVTPPPRASTPGRIASSGSVERAGGAGTVPDRSLSVEPLRRAAGRRLAAAGVSQRTSSPAGVRRAGLQPRRVIVDAPYEEASPPLEPLAVPVPITIAPLEAEALRIEPLTVPSIEIAPLEFDRAPGER